MAKQSSGPDGRLGTVCGVPLRRRLLRGASRFACACGVAAVTAAAAIAEPAGQTPQWFVDRLTAKPDHSAWPREPQAPAGAPNVLLIMTDDVGFGASSTFGGAIPTPTFDSLARVGLRYNDFNTTALCSPTRASLLTGRNPHNVGVGDVTNAPSDFDGYTSAIPKSAGTIARVLEQHGYSTAMFGKSHLTPEWEQSAAGPYDRWPTGLGFEHFYGFLNADTDQFAPSLVLGTEFVDPPANDPDYILDHDLADHAIRWLKQHAALAPTKPFFLYYATGSTHAPQQAPKAWIEKFKGRFDEGWDRLREESFARQKALGVIPADTKLTPRPPELPAWDSLTATQKALAGRYMEAYAAQLSYGDDQIGRVIDHLKQTGQLDNTMIIFIEGDNGPSAEGGLHGLIHEQASMGRVLFDEAYDESRISDLGGPSTYNLYPAEWAWAMSTPFQWFKQVASHFGGTRNGMVISWPKRIKDAGGVRSQFSFVTDIAPTILDAAGTSFPATLDGVPQKPLDGFSLTYTFDNATAKPRHNTQYFEMVGNMGLYRDGWVLASHPARMPWQYSDPTPVDQSKREWELYDVDHDFSESENLAEKYPDKVRALQEAFLDEAERSHALPVHNQWEGVAGRPSLGGPRTEFEYYPGTERVSEDAAPHLMGKSYIMTAYVDIPAAGAEGVLLAQGGRFSGYSFYLDKGRVTFTYNAVPPRLYTAQDQSPLTAGHHVIGATFASDTAERGSGGTMTLTVDGKTVAQGRIEHTMAVWLSHTEGLDIGEDTITAVSDSYSVPATFTGTLRKIVVQVK